MIEQQIIQTQRIACYIRVSTNEQKLRGLSPEAQRQVLQKYADDHNLKIVEWYEDLGVSGRKLIKNRPALQRMIQDAEHGKFDRIIFIKLDRYFRSVGEYYECQKRLDAKNVAWTATEEKYDLTTASGRYWVTQKLAMAEYEADQAGERVDLINEYKIKTGQPLTGSHNLGIAYTVQKDENGIKKVVKDPATEQLVMDYINYFLIHQNKRQAQAYINGKYGTSYAYNTLTKLLTDTKIYGSYRGNDYYCMPYIDKETWDRIQDILKSNVKQTASRRVYLFTGLLVCPNCGYKMAGTYSDKQVTNRKSGKKYVYEREYFSYRCNNAYKDAFCTHRKRTSEDVLEKKLLETLDLLVMEHIEVTKIEDARKQDDCAEQKIKEIKSEMTRLNTMYQKNRISEEKYDRDFEDLEAQLLELERHLEPLQERDLDKYYQLIESDWKNLYHALNRENKRAFWRKYIKHIIVGKDGRLERAIFF